MKNVEKSIEKHLKAFDQEQLHVCSICNTTLSSTIEYTLSQLAKEYGKTVSVRKVCDLLAAKINEKIPEGEEGIISGSALRNRYMRYIRKLEEDIEESKLARNEPKTGSKRAKNKTENWDETSQNSKSKKVKKLSVSAQLKICQDNYEFLSANYRELLEEVHYVRTRFLEVRAMNRTLAKQIEEFILK